MNPGGAGPVRLAIVNDYELVVAGLAAMLEEHRDRVHVVEINAQTRVLSDVDVVLVDTFGQARMGSAALAALREQSRARVVLYSWQMPRAGIERALSSGASGCLSKALTAKEIVDALEAIRDGEVVIMTNALAAAEEPAPVGGWPGQEYGLSSRESEVLAFITQGFTNQEIADHVHVSINSVKTYVRMAYRKIGVTRRSQAVSWGMRHGFAPRAMRLVEPAG